MTRRALSEPTGKRLKRFRYSLLTLMIFVTLAGAGLGWIRARMDRARAQRDAVAAIRAVGGTVEYDFQYSFARDYRDSRGKPSAPVWLRRRLGDEYFQEVTAVQLDHFYLDDDALAAIAALDRLEELSITGSMITDAGMEKLARLRELRSLTLIRNPNVTDDGFKHLVPLKKLRVLKVTRITDDGLQHLRGMTEMETLNLKSSRVTGTGLVHLARMSKLKKLLTPAHCEDLAHLSALASLEELYLYRTGKPGATDCLSHLAVLKQLRVLSLGGDLCSDAGLASLAGLKNLRTLTIGGDRLTDAGLVHLPALTGLKELTIYRAKITDSGLATLKALPQLQSLDLTESAGIGDPGIEHLNSLVELKTLGLRGTRVTVVGLMRLDALRFLRRVDIDGLVSPEAKSAVRRVWPGTNVRWYGLR